MVGQIGRAGWLVCHFLSFSTRHLHKHKNKKYLQEASDQWRRNVFEDTWDKISFVLNLVGTIFKNRTFSRLCSKIWLGHFPICSGVPALLRRAGWKIQDVFVCQYARIIGRQEYLIFPNIFDSFSFLNLEKNIDSLRYFKTL